MKKQKALVLTVGQLEHYNVEALDDVLKAGWTVAKMCQFSSGILIIIEKETKEN